jgi:endonuclease YncB( thermonuclease family)
MRLVSTALVVAIASCVTCASEGAPLAGAVSAAVVRVIDGDTFEARAEVWPDIHVTVAVRVAGIDAPELHARCAREREAAVSARALLAGALPPGAAVLLTRIAHDKYAGRVIAEVWLPDGRAAAPLLLGAGLAAAYGQPQDWCSG